MRLVCPNCGAQYEVPDDVIPDNGRDVQCSNCGHTWFEYAAKPVLTPPAEPAAADPAPSEHFPTDPEAPEAPDHHFPKDPEAPAAQQHEDEPDFDDDFDDVDQDDDDDEDDDILPAPTAQPRQAIDPAVADILRQEAEREITARQHETQSLESQPDLGIDDLMDDDEDDLPPASPSRIASASEISNADRLPDIEEINSTLDPMDGASASAVASMEASLPEAEAARRSGFRTGFFGVVLIAALAALAYVYGPQISQQVPALADTMASYSDSVDKLRLWLDLRLQGLMG